MDGKRMVSSAPEFPWRAWTAFAAQSYATSTSIGIDSLFSQGRVSYGTVQILLTKRLNRNKLCTGKLEPA
jgi:hypothetical protein